MGKNIYKKRVHEALFCIIIDGLFLLVSIPLIVISAIYQYWWLLGLAILAFIFAFFTLPFISILSRRIFICKQTYYLVTKDGLLNIDEIAYKLNKSEEQIKKELSILVNHRCLFGYVIDYNHNVIKKMNHYK